MMYFSLLTLLGLSQVLLQCKGQVSLLTDKSRIVVPSGNTARINWTFVPNDPPKTSLTWSFQRRGAGSKELEIAHKPRTSDVATISGNILPGIAIENPATLVLKNVNGSYNGKYKLFVLIGTAFNQSTVDLYVAEKPNVAVCSKNVKVDEGKNVTCLCTSEGGNPPAIVTWTKDGKEKIGVTEKHNNTLFLRDVNGTDEGNYECTAESYPDDLYRDTETVSVKVRLNYKPSKTIVKFSPDPAVLGKRVVITCVSNGRPEPRHVIIHNGTTIADEPVVNDFEIFPVFWNSTGIHQCNATNALGSNTNTSFLRVVLDGIVPSPTPTSTTTLASSSAINGENGTVESKSKTGGLDPGAIAGIVIGVLLLVVIVIIVLYYFKIRKRDGHKSHSNVNPGGSGNQENQYELEDNELAGQYDSVSATTSSKKKPESSSPAVYAAVNKEDRQGKPLYATLDTVAMEDNGSKKKRNEDRPPPTEYASIDFARGDQPPKADLV